MKFLFTIVILSFIAMVTFNIVLDSAGFFENIITTLSVWLYKVYPPVFTFYIIASLLINTGLINRFVYASRSIFKKLKFKSEKQLQLFIVSIFTGNPGTISLIGEATNNTFSKKDANELLRCTSFLNPLFIISYLGAYNIKYAIILIFVHISSNVLIAGYLNRNNEPTITAKTEISFSLDAFFKSINSIISVLLMVSAVMVITNILYYSIDNLISLFGKTPPFLTVLLAHIEIVMGMRAILLLNFPITATLLIFAFLSGFGGFSIHMQVLNLTLKYNLKYKIFFKYRIIQGIIGAILILPFLML